MAVVKKKQKAKARPSVAAAGKSTRPRRQSKPAADFSALKPAGGNQQSNQISQLNDWFEIALNNMARGLSMFDSDQRLVVCNNLYRQIFDLPEELTRPGTPFLEIIRHHVWNETGGRSEGHLRNQRKWIDDHVEAMSRGQTFSDTKYLKNGRIILVTNQPLADGGWVDLQEDITEKSLAADKIAWLARHDTLTELSNRFHFRESLQEILASGKKFAVFWIDLDRFKDVNDTYGHPVGDALLKSVAIQLRKAVRKSDVVARLGGDEFALIRTGDVSTGQLEVFAARLMRAIERPHRVLGVKLTMGASIGIAVAPEHGDNPDEILKNSDLALYSAKTAGRGTHAFYRLGDKYEMRRAEMLEHDLRLASRKKQLQLFYQPIVDLGTQKVASFEALMRWHHPVRGMVPPMEFIPIAEETGLIVEIGRWALAQACKDAKRFPNPIKVTVNLSSVQFEKGDLYKVVVDALEDSGLSPERLELEITETVLLRDHPKTHDLLHRIRKLGVKIALDDFGTAYASLSYLRSFPFDKIKIDRSFVREINTTAKGRDCVAIVQSVAGLAKRLQMKTVAEGVETPDQFDLVGEAGCDEVQGFYFSKPVPAAEITDTLTKCRNLFRLHKKAVA